MGVIHLPHGIGYTLGDHIVTANRMHVNAGSAGGIWYVHHTGSDAYDGVVQYKPLATLGAAVASASAGDIIVLMDGHTETLTAEVALAVDLTIVGAGLSDGKPTVKLTNNQASGNMIRFSGGYQQFNNIWVCAEAQSNDSSTLLVNGSDGVRVRGCYFECDGNTQASAFEIYAASATDRGMVHFDGTTFISTATLVTAQPITGILACQAGTDFEAVIADGLVLDNGTCGWEYNVAAYFVGNTHVNWVAMRNVSLLRGANIIICSQTNGYVHVGTSYGGGRVDWTTDCALV